MSNTNIYATGDRNQPNPYSIPPPFNPNNQFNNQNTNRQQFQPNQPPNGHFQPQQMSYSQPPQMTPPYQNRFQPPPPRFQNGHVPFQNSVRPNLSASPMVGQPPNLPQPHYQNGQIPMRPPNQNVANQNLSKGLNPNLNNLPPNHPNQFLDPKHHIPYNNPNNNPPNTINQFNNTSTPQHRQIVNLANFKEIVSPFGWYVHEPDMSFTRRIHGNCPPTERTNCLVDIMRATINACPVNQNLLKKCKLPFGILLQPFKDVSNLSVITTHKEIVRCARCRTYINPFVMFIDIYRWRCNICLRVNDVPDHFHQSLTEKGQSSHGRASPETRPEVNSSTIEYIAPTQYSTRPPPPVRYVYLLDISYVALQSGYLHALCESIIENYKNIQDRHDSRLQFSFICFDSSLHFFEICPEYKKIRHLVVSDFGESEKDLDMENLLPRPENLLINASEYKDIIIDFLTKLPSYNNIETASSGRALGPAIKACIKLLSSSGGRCSLFTAGLPNVGYGKLKNRNNNNHVCPKSGKVENMHSSTDIYKTIALECNGNQNTSIQMAIDTFFISSQYSDLSTVSEVARWSSGSVFHYPNLHIQHDKLLFEKFKKDLDRYLTRKIGFDAVLRIRMTQGIKVSQFHGNAFVRGEDILSISNLNPDAGYAVNLEIDDNIDKFSNACFQAALLYTNSRGERRVRVHTMAMPMATKVEDIFYSADGRASAALLAQMAIDRAMEYTILDARQSLEHAISDSIKAFKETVNVGGGKDGALIYPSFLAPMVLYISSLLKSPALNNTTPIGMETLDVRINSMCQIKQRPAEQTLLEIYPSLYRVDNIDELPGEPPQKESSTEENQKSDSEETDSESGDWETPDFLPLSAQVLQSDHIYLMDAGYEFILYVGKNTTSECMMKFFKKMFPNEISEVGGILPEVDDSMANARLREFIENLSVNSHRPFHAPLRIIRDDSQYRQIFLKKLIHDKNGPQPSYHEFLNKNISPKMR